MMIVSTLGGFLALTTKLIGWLIAGYQNFAFRKSGIKKLYYYSRTKSKNEMEDGSEPDSRNSVNTIGFSGNSDFNSVRSRSDNNRIGTDKNSE